MLCNTLTSFFFLLLCRTQRKLLCHLKWLCTSFNNKPGKNDAWTGAFQAESGESFALEAARAGGEQCSWAARMSHPSVLAGNKYCTCTAWGVKMPVPCPLPNAQETSNRWPGQSSLGPRQFIAWSRRTRVILFAPVF